MALGIAALPVALIADWRRNNFLQSPRSAAAGQQGSGAPQLRGEAPLAGVDPAMQAGRFPELASSY